MCQTNFKKVIIHSDGACHGNPGPGGWAAVISTGADTRELAGGVPATTNNRMDLQAAIEALASLTEPCEVEFHTDSTYVKNGITSWLSKWKRNGWRTVAKQPVKNEDLWRLLDVHAAKHQVRWHWVKGHAGHPVNERCDELANEQIHLLRKNHTPDRLNEQLKEFKAQEARYVQVGDLFG